MDYNILEETLVRYDELLTNDKFIQNVIDNYKYRFKYDVIKTISKIVNEILDKEDIDLVIPNNFNIITEDNNDNINRIIYWSYYKTIFPDNANDNINELDIYYKRKIIDLEKKSYLQELKMFNENLRLSKEVELNKQQLNNIYIIFIIYLFIRWINYLLIPFPLTINI